MMKIWILGVTLLLTSCAGKTTTSDSANDAAKSGISPEEALQTSIDIRYHLGHSHRHLQMHVEPKDTSLVTAQITVDGSVLKESHLNAQRYSSFISKVRNFVDKRRSLASSTPPPNGGECHDPYQVEIKNGLKKDQADRVDTLKVEGCRIQDEGAFSHLINEGEFLIYH